VGVFPTREKVRGRDAPVAQDTVCDTLARGWKFDGNLVMIDWYYSMWVTLTGGDPFKWYRTFATRVSQLKIWNFWVIGTERNVYRCTFNSYIVI